MNPNVSESSSSDSSGYFAAPEAGGAVHGRATSGPAEEEEREDNQSRAEDEGINYNLSKCGFTCTPSLFP